MSPIPAQRRHDLGTRQAGHRRRRPGDRVYLGVQGYGEVSGSIPSDHGPLTSVSAYSASKAACEAVRIDGGPLRRPDRPRGPADQRRRPALAKRRHAGFRPEALGEPRSARDLGRRPPEEVLRSRDRLRRRADDDLRAGDGSFLGDERGDAGDDDGRLDCVDRRRRDGVCAGTCVHRWRSRGLTDVPQVSLVVDGLDAMWCEATMESKAAACRWVREIISAPRI